MSEELRNGEDFAAVPAHREAKRLYGAYEALSALPDSAPLPSDGAEGKKRKKRKTGGISVKRESQKVPRIHIAPGVYMPR